MKVELKHQFHIESSRFLPHLESSHPCSRMHGHSFTIILRLAGSLDPKKGWLMDFNDLSREFQPLLRELDHRVLNEVPGLENPTSENLCIWIYQRLQSKLPILNQVTVRETRDTECSYPA